MDCLITTCLRPANTWFVICDHHRATWDKLAVDTNDHAEFKDFIAAGGVQGPVWPGKKPQTALLFWIDAAIVEQFRASTNPACECGSSAVGSPKHSDWCPLA